MNDLDIDESGFIKKLTAAARLREEVVRLESEMQTKQREYEKAVLELLRVSPFPAEIFRDMLVELEKKEGGSRDI